MWWKFVKVLETCWFPKILIQNVLAIFSKNLLFIFLLKILNLKLVENLVEFSLENFDILIKIRISQDDLVLSFEKLIKTLLGFLMKILANILKAFLFLLKIFEPKTCWGIFFWKFWYSYQNLWGIFEMIMSFGNLIKNFVGLCQKRTMNFSKILLDFLRTFIVTFKKNSVNLRAWDARDSLVKSCVM